MESIFFCDRGAWHGYSWGERSLVDCIAFDRGECSSVRVSRRVVERRVRDDGLEAILDDGGSVSISYVDARTTSFVVEGDARLSSAGGAVRLFDLGDGVYQHVYQSGPAGPGEDLRGLPRTLRWNWRVPHGDIRHGGVVPSPRAYPGFWAWDSWKHAAVLPPRLAREQILAMLDHQREDGMIPDTVMVDSHANNWRNSKPPLAAWACSRHESLLEECRPALLRYHRWWEENRRPPGERLFAYGGDDLEASRWESGWDNATRYDDVELRDGLQSVLSVDLNAYLCLEKRLLGIPDPELERLVDETFFHDGAYYDVTWPDHRPVRTLTAATWIPLWCGIASAAHARAVIALLLHPEHFATPVPFPAVARSDPRFEPDGYWRGSVWYDHAALGVEVLLRHGHRDAALDASRRLLSTSPDWECYNPLTGEPAAGERPAVPQFGWTAAARWSLTRLLQEPPA